MHAAQIFKTYDVAKLLKGMFAVGFGAQVVTPGESSPYC